jgi:hypothetical protein
MEKRRSVRYKEPVSSSVPSSVEGSSSLSVNGTGTGSGSKENSPSGRRFSVFSLGPNNGGGGGNRKSKYPSVQPEYLKTVPLLLQPFLSPLAFSFLSHFLCLFLSLSFCLSRRLRKS